MERGRRGREEGIVVEWSEGVKGKVDDDEGSGVLVRSGREEGKRERERKSGFCEGKKEQENARQRQRHALQAS
jgi:hypothetical protein